MITFRAPRSAIASSASTKSSSSWNSWPTSDSASAWFGVTRNGSASTPIRSDSPSQSSAEGTCRRAGRGSPRRRSPRARRAAASRRRRRGCAALREVAKLRVEELELLGPHGRPPLVDLRVARVRRVDDGRGRARLALDAHEVVEDRLAGQPLDDPQPGLAAGEPGGDDRNAERLQRAGDVDPLPAGEREARARAMPLAPLEVRDGDRAGERGVERDRDDHGRDQADDVVDCTPRVPARRGPRDPASRPSARDERRASRAAARPRRPAPRPSTCPRRTGSDDAAGATTRSVSGTPDAHDGSERRRGDERERRAAVRELDAARTPGPRATASTCRYWASP